jgi:hypothetical protein
LKYKFLVHGVEPGFKSKFWVSVTNDDSSSESDYDEQSTEPEQSTESEAPPSPVPIMKASSTTPQARQPDKSPKVCTNSQQGSTSKEVDEGWTVVRKGRVKPWSCPLPSLRQSPMRTLGDMLSKAKFVHRSTEAYHGGGIGCRQWCGSPKMSSAKMKHESMPAVTTATLHTDQATKQDLSPVKGSLNPIEDVLTELGRHERILGHEREPARQKSGCRFTPGLIAFFNKTGC